MRWEACASAGDVIALSERRASMAAIKGADRLRRKGKRFICRGFHLLGRPFGQPSTLFEGLASARPNPGFYRYFGNRVETWSCEERGLHEGINFFNGLPFLSQNVHGGPSRRQARHIVDSLLEWRSSPQNNNRTSTE